MGSPAGGGLADSKVEPAKARCLTGVELGDVAGEGDEGFVGVVERSCGLVLTTLEGEDVREGSRLLDGGVLFRLRMWEAAFTGEEDVEAFLAAFLAARMSAGVRRRRECCGCGCGWSGDCECDAGGGRSRTMCTASRKTPAS